MQIRGASVWTYSRFTGRWTLRQWAPNNNNARRGRIAKIRACVLRTDRIPRLTDCCHGFHLARCSNFDGHPEAAVCRLLRRH